MVYDDGGIKVLKFKVNGGCKCENMIVVEEKVLLVCFAYVVGVGELLNIYALKVVYEKVIRYLISDSMVYNLLHGMFGVS